MKKRNLLGGIAAGAAAGAVNGLFGAGGGMLLVPGLSLLTELDRQDIFPASLAVILPLSVISLAATGISGEIPWREALPWLPGSAIGGWLAGRCARKIPDHWLHRVLGLLILAGGVRYLW